MSFAGFSSAALKALKTRVLAQKNESIFSFVLNSVRNKQRLYLLTSASPKDETYVKFAEKWRATSNDSVRKSRSEDDILNRSDHRTCTF
jgi:hypothetical protein